MYDPIVKITTTKCEFCNEAESTSKITSRLGDVPEPEIHVLVCEHCLKRLEQGEELVDIYAWSWVKHGDRFWAEYIEITEEELNDV